MLVNVPSIRIKSSSQDDAATKIVQFWSNEPRPKLKPLRLMSQTCLSTVCMGLGDTMMLTDFPLACSEQGKTIPSFSASPHFRPLMKFNPHWQDWPDKAYMVNAPDLIRQYNCGNGHYLQRIRRAFGLKVNDIPKGFLVQKPERLPNRVILHFEAGIHAKWQRVHIHPQARTLHEDCRLELEKFIAQNPQWQFVQVGQNPIPINGVYNVESRTTEQLVNLIATGTYFIGIVSGPMHVATALGLKCVVALNFPEPETIYLPTLIASGRVESEWLYPQNTILHQERVGGLIERFSCYNLFRAFNNELYPFGKPEIYAPLIHEKL